MRRRPDCSTWIASRLIFRAAEKLARKYADQPVDFEASDVSTHTSVGAAGGVFPRPSELKRTCL